MPSSRSSGPLPNLSSCWQNSFPWSHRTHSSLLLRGCQDIVSESEKALLLLWRIPNWLSHAPAKENFPFDYLKSTDIGHWLHWQNPFYLAIWCNIIKRVTSITLSLSTSWHRGAEILGAILELGPSHRGQENMAPRLRGGQPRILALSLASYVTAQVTEFSLSLVHWRSC